MDMSEWHYELPDEMIAQQPIADRAASRFLVYNRADKSINHRHFSDITGFLRPGDCLVLNSSRVISARLHGIKTETGGRIEVFILRHMGGNRFEVLLKPKRKIRIAIEMQFPGGLRGRLVERAEKLGDDVFEFTPPDGSDLFDAIENAGEVPLPPYVKGSIDDPERYQTVYAHQPGSVAAPTAGLHFTPGLLRELEGKGVHIAKLDLKVGWGTFSKVTDAEIEAGALHPEEVEITPGCARIINDARSSGGLIYACGTTSVRALEASFARYSGLKPMSGTVDLFIQPGFEFKVVDRMITNFHLPGTSLLMLVAAFMGKGELFRAYAEAIMEGYRFYSFGDAMLIL